MPSFTVSPSALAYLYGDQFEDLFGGRSRFTGSVELPCRGVKVKDKDLAVAVLAATLACLAAQRQVEFSWGTTGRVFKSKALFIQRSGQAASWHADSFEAQLLAQISGVAKKDDTPSVVGRLWSRPHEYPWRDVFDRVQHYLLSEGYYVLEERQGLKKLLGAKLVPVCAKVLALEVEATQLHVLVAEWRTANREVYQQLWTDVGKGIASRAEKPDVDV